MKIYTYDCIVIGSGAAGYNAEDVKMNRLLKEYAKFRMITVFPWSRSWTLEPSKSSPTSVTATSPDAETVKESIRIRKNSSK